MFLIAIICPIIITGMGLCFRRKAPTKINRLFGYRTKKSMRNEDTWKFAHKYIGNLWLVEGLILIILSVVSMLCVIEKNDVIVIVVSLTLCIVEIIAIIVSIIFTERALKRLLIKGANHSRLAP